MKSVVIKIALYALVFFAISGCSSQDSFIAKAVDKADTNRLLWLAYWDLDAGGKDLTKLGMKAGQVAYFAAYFDPLDRLMIPAALSDIKNTHKRKKVHWETYLTFVNDKGNLDGSFALKDIEVIRRVLSKDGLLDKHVDDIIKLAKEHDFNGIEIDYERVWKDEEVGKLFIKFVDKLYLRAREQNLKLRVVLEPNAPFATAAFTVGPEYVVMHYNLYGLHSGPGPKANKAFIQKLLADSEKLPGERSIAFATGGCVWGSDGKKQLLTEQEIAALSSAYNAIPTRDEDSQNLVFNYENNGIAYIVWYADVNTLNYWSKIAKDQGVDKISFWRLGGNVGIQKIK